MILKKILPQLEATLSKIIDGSIGHRTREEGAITEKMLDATKRDLEKCERLLTLWQICLNRIIDVGQVAANDIASLLDTSLAAIKLCFQHCKSSERAYGRGLFEGLTVELGNLFRAASATLRLFLTALEEDLIVFDTDVQSETESVAKVVSAVGSIAVIANGMDLKTFVETMKSFARLALKHHRTINLVSPESVNVHIRSLAESCCLAISDLEEPNKSVSERTLKSVNLTVKVLEKLIAVYGSSAASEIFYSLVELLARMYRCSQSGTGPSKMEARRNATVDKRIATVGAEALLSRIFDVNVRQLKKAFFEYGSQVDVDKLAYHTLTLAIMRKLCGAYRRECISDSNSIIDVAFANINCLHEELFCGEVRIPFAYCLGEDLQQIGIYEGTLALICRLISKVPGYDLRDAEICLLKYTLNGQFWSALLSLDVWTFVGRLASTELCENYVKYFMRIYATFEKVEERMETVVLGNLIKRLYSLLPNEARHRVVEHSLSRADLHSWIPPFPYLSDETRFLLRDRFLPSHEISATFADLQEQSNSRRWNDLTRLLRVARKLRYSADDKTIEVSSKIWSLLGNTIEGYDERQVRLSTEIISALLNINRATVPSDEVFLSILHAVIGILPFVPSHVAVSTAFRMREDVNSLNDCNPEVATALTELSSNLLNEKNPIVFQEGLETFDEIVNICPDENLIRKMASAIRRKPPWVGQLIRAYMSNLQCCELQGYSSVNAYIRQLASGTTCSATHACHDYDHCRKDEKHPRIEESPEYFDKTTPSNLDQRVNAICDQLNDLTKLKSAITVDALRKLRAALSKLTD